jgi:hypothetical protein
MYVFFSEFTHMLQVCKKGVRLIGCKTKHELPLGSSKASYTSAGATDTTKRPMSRSVVSSRLAGRSTGSEQSPANDLKRVARSVHLEQTTRRCDRS